VTAPGFRLARATIRDIDALTRCRLDLFRELQGEPAPAVAAGFEVRCREALREGFAGDTLVAWVARPAGGEPIGSLILLLYPRLPSLANLRTREGYLINVYTRPDCRGRGVGGALMDAALAHARRLGLARIRLHASPLGRPLYDRYAFHGRDDEMELDLTGP